MIQLNEIFGNKVLFEILTFFIKKPSITITQTELIKNLKIAKATAVKWTNRLVFLDIIKCNKIGVSNLYTLNNDDIIVKHIKILNNLVQLKPLSRLEDVEVYLYGSSARGENHEKSDIDILILGNSKRNELINKIDDLSKKINKKINFNIFTNLEWSMLMKSDKSYYTRIEKDKIRLK
jgi:predicted nucleotidyltransferase